MNNPEGGNSYQCVFSLVVAYLSECSFFKKSNQDTISRLAGIEIQGR